MNITGILNICLLVVFKVCILYNFIKAAWVGPGYVALKWKPVSLEFIKKLSFEYNDT